MPRDPDPEDFTYTLNYHRRIVYSQSYQPFDRMVKCVYVILHYWPDLYVPVEVCITQRDLLEQNISYDGMMRKVRDAATELMERSFFGGWRFDQETVTGYKNRVWVGYRANGQ